MENWRDVKRKGWKFSWVAGRVGLWSFDWNLWQMGPLCNRRFFFSIKVLIQEFESLLLLFLFYTLSTCTLNGILNKSMMGKSFGISEIHVIIYHKGSVYSPVHFWDEDTETWNTQQLRFLLSLVYLQGPRGRSGSGLGWSWAWWCGQDSILYTRMVHPPIQASFRKVPQSSVVLGRSLGKLNVPLKEIWILEDVKI